MNPEPLAPVALPAPAPSVLSVRNLVYSKQKKEWVPKERDEDANGEIVALDEATREILERQATAAEAIQAAQEAMANTLADILAALTASPNAVLKVKSSDQALTDATLANVSGLSQDLEAGETYEFEYTAFLNAAAVDDGVKINWDGGTATFTAFIGSVYILDGGVTVAIENPALAAHTDVADAHGLTAQYTVLKVTGTLFVNAAGTFFPKMAKYADVGGDLTVQKGTKLKVEKVA